MRIGWWSSLLVLLIFVMTMPGRFRAATTPIPSGYTRRSDPRLVPSAEPHLRFFRQLLLQVIQTLVASGGLLVAAATPRPGIAS
jgi:hypothetical protein